MTMPDHTKHLEDEVDRLLPERYQGMGWELHGIGREEPHVLIVAVYHPSQGTILFPDLVCKRDALGQYVLAPPLEAEAWGGR